MDSSPGQVVGAARDVTPPGGRRSRRRRRPTGEPPPLPRHLETTGVGWLVAAVGLIALSLLVFTAGRYGRGVSFTVVDNWVLEWLAARRSPGLTSLMRGLTEVLGTIWTIKVLAWFTVIVLVVYKRFRHLVVGLLSVQLVSLVVSPSRRRCAGRGPSGWPSREAGPAGRCRRGPSPTCPRSA